MARYIDADALYERTAEWEASALAYIEKLNRTPLEEMDEDERAEWRRWTAILGERSAFKHDVADAPTADVVEVVRCKDCKHLEIINGPRVYARCNRHDLPIISFGLIDTREWFCADGERREG